MMDAETVHVATASRGYDVIVGTGLLDQVGALAKKSAGGARCCIITETNVGPLYADRVERSLSEAGYDVADRLVFPAGERNKTLSTLGGLLEGLAERSLTRSDVVVALGGGVTGDMGGLAAALYLRGIRVVQIPTSLLAMVDSSVGGKTAVDLAAGKNLVGAFWQPSLVVADVTCLQTIGADLFTDSCGEVVKHAILADAALLDELCELPLNAPESSQERLARIIARNVAIKRDVVSADEREAGVRQTLNLGHTIGHAIEAASDFTLGHGSCVAAGLCMIARAARRLDWCSMETSEKIERCVAAHGLPTGTDLSTDTLMRYIAHDKKRHNETVNLVIPREIGRSEVRPVALSELAHIVDLAREGDAS